MYKGTLAAEYGLSAPRVPYPPLADGTLREQMAYPGSPQDLDDALAMGLLDKVRSLPAHRLAVRGR